MGGHTDTRNQITAIGLGQACVLTCLLWCLTHHGLMTQGRWEGRLGSHLAVEE